MNALAALRHWRVLERGWAEFRRSQTTPESAYHSLRWLHCHTGGVSTDFMARRARRLQPARDAFESRPQLEAQTQETPLLTAKQHDQALQQLHTEGFHVFAQRVPLSVCNQLEQYALTQQAQLHPRPDNGPATARYDPRRPLSETYRFEEERLVQEPAIQNLIADPSLYLLARAYLRCEPILDLVTMWWSVPQGGIPSSAAAQLYHFDMDRIHWLKIFVYLSEVCSERGPHCFLKKTHRRGESSRRLLRLGDRRIEDTEIQALGLEANQVEILGPRGTVVAVDTRGHHKGKPPLSGDRLILQFEYASSLFGAPYQRLPRNALAPQLQKAAQFYPRVFERFSLKDE